MKIPAWRRTSAYDRGRREGISIGRYEAQSDINLALAQLRQVRQVIDDAIRAIEAVRLTADTSSD